jgi:hypothetical protein
MGNKVILIATQQLTKVTIESKLFVMCSVACCTDYKSTTEEVKQKILASIDY